ncbi:colicin E3/pyocin S6 family cytotoxin [Peribacillus sp. R9-11]|uniref:colicin E3/pyocin S6 family cytotoxin n=1 Tax=Peribacillus sp. R9-11 TaxID=3073271 RepID=UPI0028693A26|nr:colicin E3/pyocin S6 family cytotoxin [Peribacillus sp. R9-11]WMX57433.1 colicin E3/pyocin S6 family cytotoxin [Peribacillus sp. R9-11]
MVHKILPRPSFLDTCVSLKVVGNRKVWRSHDGKRLYTWDSLHGEIEVFNRQGRHLGSADAISGALIKTAVKGRKLDV